VRSGQLRQIVTIQSPQNANTGLGYEQTWVDFAANIRAGVEPLVGREYFSAGQTQTTVSHRIRIRYVAGVKASMRVVMGSRIFNIKDVIDPQERHRELQLMAEESTEAPNG
jgi:SPP1 family predicted phage head-tail adaptor